MTIDPFQTLIIASVLLFATSLSFYFWDFKASLLIVPLMGVIIYRFIGNFDTLTMLVSPVVFGSFTGLTIRKNFSVQFYVLGSTFALTIITVSAYYYLLNVLDIDAVQIMTTQLNEVISSSTLSSAEKQELRSNIDIAISIVRDVMPFYLFLISLIYSTIAFIILRLFYSVFILKRPLFLKGLEFFKLNDFVIFLLIASMALYVFITPEQSEIANNAALNALCITAFLYVIQALGIIRHFLIKKKLPLFILPLGIFITLLFSWPLLPIVSILLAGWGVLDLWTDFRHLNKKNNIEKE
jgi:hypothetical protein